MGMDLEVRSQMGVDLEEQKLKNERRRVGASVL